MSTSTAALSPVPPGPIRVVEIVGNAILGGMETCVERLIERLPRERFSVTAILPYEGAYADRLRAFDAEVFVTPVQDNPPWCSVQMICSMIESGNVDVLHAHLPNAHVLAGLCGRLTGTPVLATIHGRQVNMLDLEVHRTAGTHIGVLCKQSYFHALGVGVSPSHLHLIPNGVDIDVFRPSQAAAIAAVNGASRSPGPQGSRIEGVPADGGQTAEGTRPWRASLGIPSAAPLVGFVGRLSVEKGPEVFVRAALLIHSTIPEAHFVLVGEGPMRERLEELCRNYSLTGFLHFAGLCRDMPAIYRELDLVVSTSYSEAMPLALMEAMASGLPVIATRVGGVPELIMEGETGRLAEPGDFERIALLVGQLIENPEQRELMGAAARARTAQHFGLAESVNHAADLLTRLAVSRQHEARKMSTVVGDPTRKVARATRLGTDARGAVRSDRSA